MKPLFLFSALNLLIILALSAQTPAPIHSAHAIHHPVMAQNGMVSSQHPLATEVGLDILKQGGNAVDAGVAVGFALAVVLPRAGNLGGGGFMLIHDAASSKTSAVDYREVAPAKSTRDMYLGDDGAVDRQRFNQSYLSIGVPGTVAGLLHALETGGTMDLSTVLTPAIKLAQEGFPISFDLAAILEKYEERMKACPATAAVFYPEEGFYQPGDTLVQSDLAWSLKQIRSQGKDGFYKGSLAQKMIKGIRNGGGVMDMADLSAYKVNVKQPVQGSYRDHVILSMPPPSSGGVHLIQMLNILEGYDLEASGPNSAATIHKLVESMKLAYADRSEHLGDPDFWKVPVKGLISKPYAESLRSQIDLKKATPSDDIKPGKPADYESEETTHYSVVDRWGNVVTNTYTLNFSFGTGLMAEGTGILLNNEMGDFSAKPGTPNAYGLIGGEANAVEAGKRPLSSMTPTLVLKDGQPYLVTGTPGGSRIITTVLQIILNVIDHDMNIAEATHQSRIHHQWYPDQLFHERALNHDTRSLLESLGHSLIERPAMGSTQSILIEQGWMQGASDPRRPDGRVKGW